MVDVKERESNIRYDETTDTYFYLNNTIHMDRLPSGMLVFRINDKNVYVSETEFSMFYLYFGLLFKRMNGD